MPYMIPIDPIFFRQNLTDQCPNFPILPVFYHTYSDIIFTISGELHSVQHHRRLLRTVEHSRKFAITFFISWMC